MNCGKRLSENARDRAEKFNPHLTRLSTKTILKEFEEKDLVKSQIENRHRVYWITKNGNDYLKGI
jgi:predicted transcriptional regulator